MSRSLPAIYRFLALACIMASGRNAAQATTIASDDFLTAASGGFYVAGTINGQVATNGTTGYYTGATAGNLTNGWLSGTGAFVAQTSGLTNPNVVNAPTSNDGSLTIVGNSNTRLQDRDLASTSPPASSDYYFSLLLSESVNSYTGTAYAGLGQARPSMANGSVPMTGFDIGFFNGALSLFYNNGGANLASESLLASPTVNQAYMVELHLAMTGPSTGTLTPFVYNSAGTLINTPASQAVTATENTAADMGAFQGFVTKEFTSGTSPAKVAFDEFRFGTSEGDVIAVPEPGTVGFLVLGAVGLLGRCRKRGSARRG